MLPLLYNDNFKKVEILVCGGAAVGSVANVKAQMNCSTSCGRLDVLRKNSTWAMETMPMPRCMGDMVLLPDLNVMIINGAKRGECSSLALSSEFLQSIGTLLSKKQHAL